MLAITEANFSEASPRRSEHRGAERQCLTKILLVDGHFLIREALRGVLKRLKSNPAISVVVLSTRQDGDSVARALDLGALGFIPKSGQREVMLSALELVLAGGVYIPPEILLREQRPLISPKLAWVASSTRPVRPADLGLTDRQVNVLGLMMTGKSNKAISRELDLALPTVKNHVTAILKAIKVTNRTEAVIAIGSLGLTWATGSAGRSPQ
jgi:DNA-binding NarL/FixJ family response regulator